MTIGMKTMEPNPDDDWNEDDRPNPNDDWMEDVGTCPEDDWNEDVKLCPVDDRIAWDNVSVTNGLPADNRGWADDGDSSGVEWSVQVLKRNEE
uniref:Uncharacterized protein n=1 Tax=Anopheles minimus TaxID=112268 RepID=A0A182WQ45_9DIPT